MIINIDFKFLVIFTLFTLIILAWLYIYSFFMVIISHSDMQNSFLQRLSEELEEKRQIVDELRTKASELIPQISQHDGELIDQSIRWIFILTTRLSCQVVLCTINVVVRDKLTKIK